MQRQFLVVVLVLSLVAATSTAVLSPPAQAQAVTVRMVWQGEANEIKLYEGLAAKFEQAHPNVKIKLETLLPLLTLSTSRRSW